MKIELVASQKQHANADDACGLQVGDVLVLVGALLPLCAGARRTSHFPTVKRLFVEVQSH